MDRKRRERYGSCAHSGGLSCVSDRNSIGVPLPFSVTVAGYDFAVPSMTVLQEQPKVHPGSP